MQVCISVSRVPDFRPDVLDVYGESAPSTIFGIPDPLFKVIENIHLNREFPIMRNAMASTAITVWAAIAMGSLRNQNLRSRRCVMYWVAWITASGSIPS